MVIRWFPAIQQCSAWLTGQRGPEEEQFICDSWLVVFPSPARPCPPCEYWMNRRRVKRKKNGFIVPFCVLVPWQSVPFQRGIPVRIVSESQANSNSHPTNMRSRRGFAFCRFKLVLIYYIVSRKCHLSAVPVTAKEPETTIWSVVATSEEVFDSIPRRKGHGDENIKINICEHRSEKAKWNANNRWFTKAQFPLIIMSMRGENEGDNEIGRREDTKPYLTMAVADDKRESKFKAVIKSQIFDIGKQSDRVVVEEEERLGICIPIPACLVVYGRIGSPCLICLG